MKKISILLVGLLFVGMQVILAQTKQITGTVTSSDDGMPLPGVSVVVKGTSIGITTDIDGEYELNVPEDANTLVFSFVGMQTQEVAIDDRSTVDVVMQPDLVG
ncbi:MAG: carboxypeptidase-like regulatory domain-containing protein, partial [Bacteroidota bacterium]